MNTAEQEQREKRRAAIGLRLVTGYIYDLPSSVRHHKELIDTMITVVDEMLEVRTYGSLEQKAQAVNDEYKDEIVAKFHARFAEEKARAEKEATEEKRAVHFDTVKTKGNIISELVPEVTERLAAVNISTHDKQQYHTRLAQACGLYVMDRITLRRSNDRPMIRLPKPDPFKP